MVRAMAGPTTMQRKPAARVEPAPCCASVRAEVLGEDDADILARSFAALADPTRLRLLSYVAAAQGEEVCACDLVAVSGRSQPTVSHHMKLLVDAGLVSRAKRGLWVWYRIDPARLDELRGALA